MSTLSFHLDDLTEMHCDLVVQLPSMLFSWFTKISHTLILESAFVVIWKMLLASLEIDYMILLLVVNVC